MSLEPRTPVSDADRIARLEERLARLETHLGLGVPAESPPPPVSMAAVEAELELEVGQNWFALAGVVALTAGAGLMLTFPYEGLPVAVPATAGFVVAAAAALAARRCERALETLARYLNGAALALFGGAALRLCFPAARAVCDPQSPLGRGVLVASAVAMFALARRSRSPWLLGLAALAALVLFLATGSSALFLAGLCGIAVLVAHAARRHDWPALAIAIAPVLAATYFAWALGNPFFAAKLKFADVPVAGPLLLLAAFAGLALESLRGSTSADEPAALKVAALVQSMCGHGTYLVTTLAAFPQGFAALQLAASAAWLGLAAMAWHRGGSRVATFFYAMTGYGALTTSILKLAPVPAVFVWLSMQSVLVVATAIWFRSRLIVVANFAIYLAIVLAYVVTAGRETGISLGFGVVALVTARILNWQKDRLALRTELMRNAYLGCAFVVFPYALAHLVPARFVVAAWVALATAYYAMNLVVTSRRYRWLGHGTLVLTSIYSVVVATRHAEPVYRTLSFLLLGAVLLGVSLAFTRARRRAQPQPQDPPPQPVGAAAGSPQAGDSAPSSSAMPQRMS